MWKEEEERGLKHEIFLASFLTLKEMPWELAPQIWVEMDPESALLVPDPP